MITRLLCIPIRPICEVIGVRKASMCLVLSTDGNLMVSCYGIVNSKITVSNFNVSSNMCGVRVRLWCAYYLCYL